MMGTLPELPAYLTTESEETIKKRMLDSLPSDLDKSEGSYIYDAFAPAAIELALAADWAQEVLRRGFASTTFGPYLEYRCAEHGLTRREAIASTGKVRFTGTTGVPINPGTLVATPADTTTGTIAVQFKTANTEVVTIGDNGTAIVDVQALEAGSAGNAPRGAISVLVNGISGITGVTNDEPAVGGMDEEDDAALLARYFQRVQAPSTGGNKADYVNWAMEIPRIGGVSVVPVRDGAGTVSVAVIDSDKKPASQTLVDTVQNYIAPPWVTTVEVENIVMEGPGLVKDTTVPNEPSVKMIYNASVAATIENDFKAVLEQAAISQKGVQQPGIWQARLRLKVDDTTKPNNLLQIGVWNVSGNAWAKTRPAGLTDTLVTLKASDLKTSFEDKILEFYWNGQDQLKLKIVRLQTNTASIVWVDKVVYRSTFSRDDGAGKAPIGARVTVEPAPKVSVNVNATLSVMNGYNIDSVKAQVKQNIDNYIKSIAFQTDNDVRYVRVGQIILDTEGVQDYSALKINNITANIPVDVQQVAVLEDVI